MTARRRLRALGLACAILAASGVPARAQAPEPAPEAVAADQVVRVFEIRYRDVSDVSVLIEPRLSPTAYLAINKRTRTVKVIDRPDVVAQVEEFIRQFDVPPHAVLVRVVLERASRPANAAGGDVPQAEEAWETTLLGETTLEVLERAEATGACGPDGAFEIHLALDAVDAERGLMSFSDVSITRVAGAPDAGAGRQRVLSTALELQDRVGKVVMASQDAQADVALIVRMRGLIRGPQPAAAAAGGGG